MENKIMKEINEFKYDVKCKGMYLDMYLNRRRHLINKIEYLSNKSLYFFRYLLFSDMISHEQYLEFKSKVDNSRKYYKSMLSLY